MRTHVLYTPVALMLAWALAAAPAAAQTTVKDAWVRGTVPQQSATGMFAHITSATGGRLVAVTSPVARVVEIHEMSMQGDVMRMRALPGGLALPAGKTVALTPSGYHVMLMDLRHDLRAGDVVPLTLVIEGADRKREMVEVKAPVVPLGAAAPGPAPAPEHHKH
jgi:copper(I)-binding protein